MESQRVKIRIAVWSLFFGALDVLETWYVLKRGLGVELNPLYGHLDLVQL